MESRSIRFPPDLWVRLEQVAKEGDRPLGWVVREACERFVADLPWIQAEEAPIPSKEEIAEMDRHVAVKAEQRKEFALAPGPEAFCDHRWERGVSGVVKCAKCGIPKR